MTFVIGNRRLLQALQRLRTEVLDSLLVCTQGTSRYRLCRNLSLLITWLQLNSIANPHRIKQAGLEKIQHIKNEIGIVTPQIHSKKFLIS